MLTRIRAAQIIPALILAGGLALTPRSAPAMADYTKKERKACTFCHQGSWNSTNFTEAGQYYKDHHTLRGYAPKPPSGGPKKT